MANETKKLNASQRLETLEVNMQEVSMYINNMARDLSIVKQAIKLLGNKLDAVVKATGISEETIAELMIDNNVAELKEKVDKFISQGVLTPSDLVTDQSFVVGREVDDAGTVQNKRLQFAVDALQPELKDKLIGSAVGTTVTFNEGSLKYIVDEIYTIVNPQAASEEQPSEQAPTQEA